MSLEIDPTSSLVGGQRVDSNNQIVGVAKELEAASECAVPGFEVRAVTNRAAPARGDFYAFQDTSYGSLAMVGDIGGGGRGSDSVMHLVPSALAEAVRLHSEPDPFALLSAVASKLDERLASERALATLSVATWDAEEGLAALASAGHCPLLHVSSSGVRQLEAGDPAIGTGDQLTGLPEVVVLAPGDFLLMGTDGLTKQRDRRSTEFGFPRLAQVLLESQNLTAEEVVAEVFSAVGHHGQGVNRGDDQTVMVMARTG